jgi:hypothetical protein
MKLFKRMERMCVFIFQNLKEMQAVVNNNNFKKKCFCSLGCGIGYGYLHRIPTRPFEEGKKISLPGQMTGTPVTPLKDGFTEVR